MREKSIHLVTLVAARIVLKAHVRRLDVIRRTEASGALHHTKSVRRRQKRRVRTKDWRRKWENAKINLSRMGMLLRPRPGVLRRSQRKHRPPRRMQTPCRPPAALRMLAVRHKACPLLGLPLWKRSRRPRPLTTPDWTHRRWPTFIWLNGSTWAGANWQRWACAAWRTAWPSRMMRCAVVATICRKLITISTAKTLLAHGVEALESTARQQSDFYRSLSCRTPALRVSRRSWKN